MSATFLIFDFETNEEAVQQGRHKLDGWKQAFRLDKKMLFKFDRGSAPAATAEAEKATGKSAEKGKAKKGAADDAAGPVKLLVRLYFSEHEKLSGQRWLQRIPLEEPFKGASPKVVHASDAAFDETQKRFDELD